MSRSMLRAWRWLPAFGLVAGVTGCGASVTSVTTLEVQDPSHVAVVRGDAIALPAGNAPAEAPLGVTDLEVIPGGHAQVEVSAVRAPTGGLSLTWATRPPLVTGDAPLPLGAATGSRWQMALPATFDPTQPEFRWDVCATLRRGKCYPLTLETPWSNVVVTRRTTVASHTRQALQTAAAVTAAPLFVTALVPAGADFGSADHAVLATLGVSAGASALLVGASFLFPGSRTCTEVLSVNPGAGSAWLPGSDRGCRRKPRKYER